MFVALESSVSWGQLLNKPLFITKVSVSSSSLQRNVALRNC